MNDINDPNAQPLHAAHLAADAPSTQKLRMVGLIAIIVAALVATGGILLRWHHKHEVADWTNKQATPIVAVIKPKKGAAGVQTVLPGNISAWYEAPIYARVNGYIRNWYYDFGAHVHKGDLLAEIDAPDVDGELAAAEANYKAAQAQSKVREAGMEFAKTTYARWRDSPKGSVSEQEQESKKADYDGAAASYAASLADVNSDKGALDRLKAMSNFKRIEAPFDGVVTARNTDKGALINAGSGNAPQLFRVADVHEMRVFVQVPQEMSAGIHNGLTADLHLPQYPDRVFKATVATTSEAINEAARTLLVELHADNPQNVLQPGTFAEVHFELPDDSTTLRIPTSALVFRQDGMQVAVLDSTGKVALHSVKLGRNLGTDIEVVSGLSPNDQVIDSPPDSLTNGDVVNVQKQSESPGKDAADASAKAAVDPPAGASLD